MTPDPYIEATNKLTEAIIAATNKTYTLTGAADWPILVGMVGVVAAMVAFMWIDMRSMLKDQKTVAEEYRREYKHELKELGDTLWSHIRRLDKEISEVSKS